MESCIWKAQYPDQKAINDDGARVGRRRGSANTKLKVVPREDQVITPADIHYYDELPDNVAAIKGTGIDSAISQK